METPQLPENQITNNESVQRFSDEATVKKPTSTSTRKTNSVVTIGTSRCNFQFTVRKPKITDALIQQRKQEMENLLGIERSEVQYTKSSGNNTVSGHSSLNAPSVSTNKPSPTKNPKLNFERSKLSKSQSKFKKGFAEGFTTSVNPKRSADLSESEFKLHSVRKQSGFPDDNDNSDDDFYSDLDSDTEFDSSCRDENQEQDKKRYFVCKKMTEPDQKAILLLEEWSDRIKIHSKLTDEEIRLQHDLFMTSLHERGLSVECTFDRFKTLSTENNLIDASSVFETRTALMGEALGFYTNLRRPTTDSGITLDFEIDGLGPY